MKNLYATQYIIIALSAISFSLSGMRVGDGQLIETKSTHTITFQPKGGLIPVTQENRPLWEIYFNNNGINLKDTEDEVICVEPIRQTDKNNKLIPITSPQYIKETLLLMPFSLFQGKTIIINNNNVPIKFTGNTMKNKNAFKAHRELLDMPIKKTSTPTNSPAAYAQNFQLQLNNNSIPALEFLAQLMQTQEIKQVQEIEPNDEVVYQVEKKQNNNLNDKIHLPSQAIPQFFSTLINESYDKQLEMIDQLTKDNQNELLVFLVKNHNLSALLSNKYNTLKTLANIGKELETDTALNEAVASFLLAEFTLEDGLFIHQILKNPSFSHIAINTLSSSVKKIIETCNTFEKILQFKTEEQKLTEEGVENKKILINNEFAALSNVIKAFSKYQNGVHTKNGKIIFTIPQEIDEKIAEICFNLLDQCLLINADLEENIIKTLRTRLNNCVKDLSYETLMEAMSLYDYLEIADEYNGKEIILPSLLQSTFIEKLVNEPYENCNTIINSLDPDSKADILKMVMERLGLQKKLEDKYNSLKLCANIKKHLADNLIQTTPCKKGDILDNLSLSQMLLIHDVLNEKVSKDLITDDNVSTPVKCILDACKYFEKEIEKAKEGRRLRQEHAKQLEAEEYARREAARIVQEKKNAENERWNNLIQGRIYNQIANVIAFSKRNPGFTAYCAGLIAYIYYFSAELKSGAINFANIFKR